MIPYDENFPAMVGIRVEKATRTGREVGVISIKASADELGA